MFTRIYIISDFAMLVVLIALAVRVHHYTVALSLKGPTRQASDAPNGDLFLNS